MAQIKISQLVTGTPKATDETPAVDVTDLTQAPSGSTKKYIRSDELNFYLSSIGYATLAACSVATTSPLTATYNNGASGVGATLTNSAAQSALVVDGVTVSVGTRVLVKNQASAFQNGIYTVSNVGSGSTNWVLTRATDYNISAQMAEGNLVLVSQGAVNAEMIFEQRVSAPIIVGTTSIIFTLFSFSHFPITPYVVGPVGQAGYQTIQAAVNAAVSVGGIAASVFVQPGVYTENINFSGCTVFTVGLTLTGAVGLGDQGQVEIVGHHTPPASGALVLRNLKLSDASHIFTGATAGSAYLSFADALFNVTNGYTIDLPNWTGTFEFFDINNGTQQDGGINNTGGASLFVFEAGLGMGTTNTMVLSGTSVCDGANIGCPVNFVTGSNFNFDNTNFNHGITCSNNSTGMINTSKIQGGTSPAVTMSSSAGVFIYNSIVDSTNNPAIAGAGAGTLTIDSITYKNNTAISGSLTLAYNVFETGTAFLQNLSFNRGSTTVSTNGQLIIGNTGNNPSISTLTAGTGISISNGSGSITISNSSGFITWNSVAGTTQAAAVNNGYVIANASQTTVTLPATAALGSIVIVQGLGAAGWKLTANTGQTIKLGTATTTSAGTITSANQWDCIEVVCVVANTTWSTRSVLSAGVTLA